MKLIECIEPTAEELARRLPDVDGSRRCVNALEVNL
jgi:hypothetical protein